MSFLGATTVGNDRLGTALADYASGQEKVCLDPTLGA